MKRHKLLIEVVSVGLFVLLALMPITSVTAAENPIKITISTWAGPKHYMSRGYWTPFFIPQLEKLSKGRVKATLYTGGALGKGPQHYDMAVTGVADITWSLLGYTPGRFPLLEVLHLPFLAPDDGVVNSMVMWQLYEEFPEIQASFKETHPILLYSIPPDVFHSPKDPFKSIKDFRGKRIRGPSGVVADVIRSVGGSPLQMSIREVYQAAKTGVIDGWISSRGTLKGFKLAEATKYTYLPGWACSTFFVTMNLKKWNSLPKDIQQIIMDKLGGRVGAEWCGNLGNKDQIAGVEYTKKLGNKVEVWPKELVSELKKRAQKGHEEWIAEKEAKGLPGRAVYNRTVELLGRYGK